MGGERERERGGRTRERERGEKGKKERGVHGQIEDRQKQSKRQTDKKRATGSHASSDYQT